MWPLIEDGRIVTRIHSVVPFEQVAEAHRILDANQQIGKVVLAVDQALANEIPSSPRRERVAAC
ncbi:hypothetical protein D3C72_2161290 [compost metagenome]